MNGNVKFNDNGKRQNGKHVEFIILQNETLDLLKDDAAALSMYVFSLRCAGGKYNLTIPNLAKHTKHSTATVQRVLKKLKDLGLLKQEFNRDLTGKSQVKTSSGKIVPNNTSIYTVNAVPILQQNTVMQDMPFTIEDFESGSDDIPIEVEEYQPEPSQAAAPAKAEVSAEKKQELDKMAEEIRRQHINGIAKDNYLFGRNADRLYYWDQEFLKVTGRKADDACLNYMANILSGNSNSNLTPYLKNKALAYSRE